MSDAPKINPLNVPGKYYVTEDCLACQVCVDTVPGHFRMHEGLAYVYKQPDTPEAEEQCEEAVRTCCVEAIGARAQPDPAM
jgi:ferredoxin